MKSVVVSKTGMVLNTPSVAKQSSKGGEIGETIGLLRHLVKTGHRTVYFGKVRGELPEGVEYVEADPCGYDENISIDDSFRVMRYNAALLREVDPGVFVDMVGMSCRMHPAPGLLMMCMTVNYLMPILGGVGEIGLPTIAVLTDVRGRVKTQEMNDLYPSLRPIAVFSQRDAEYSRVVYGRQYRVREIACDAHSWWMDAGWERPEWIPFASRPLDGILLMHAHIGTGYTGHKACKTRKRQAAFANLLGDKYDLEALSKRKFVVIGDGWEKFKMSDGTPAIDAFPTLFAAPVATRDIFSTLASARCAPMIVPIERSWPLSAKASMAVASGCIPVFYGRSDCDYCYDPRGRVMPLDSAWRANCPSELRRVLSRATDNTTDAEARAVCNELLMHLAPTYSRVTECIDRTLHGDRIEQGDWWERFGGYRAV